MLGDFTYSNPTRLYFGQNALDNLRRELDPRGKTVLLVYGGGSIKRNGIYDQVVDIVSACGKQIVEDPGVMPNPTTDKLAQGCRLARESGAQPVLLLPKRDLADDLNVEIAVAEVLNLAPDCPGLPLRARAEAATGPVGSLK